MKANELMIDDWVYNKNIAKPMQIYPTIFSQMFRSNPDASTEDYNIFPIPLTPEILEKNGFKKCAGNEWSVFKYEDDDYTKKALYQVLWSANELYLEIASYTSTTGEFNRMGVEFVHQLQHALRLCGIDKTIEL